MGSPRDLADRMVRRRIRLRQKAGFGGQEPGDGFLRETFTLPRETARVKARDFLKRYPKAGYMSEVESWRELPGGEIEFTMRRLPTAD